MNPPYRRLVLGVTLALGLLSAIPGVAFAAQPSCGDTLMADTTLTANLDCSAYAGDALYMGKNRIVLNLNGHTITGWTGDDSYSGVDTNEYNHVKIKNGTINGFDSAVYLDYSSDSVVRNLTIHGEAADPDEMGVHVYYGAANIIDNNHMSGDLYYGLNMYGAAGTWVTNNSMIVDEYGVYSEYDSRDHFINNDIQSGYAGFYDDYSGHSRYIGNTTSGGDYGFYLDCDTYGWVVLQDNNVTGADSYGIYTYYCYDSESGAGSLFKNNVTSMNDDGSGNGYGWYDYYSINSKWLYNTANDNAEHGFYFYEPGNAIIRHNVAKRNGYSGFYLDDNYSAGYYNADDFSFNIANWNGDFGHYGSYAVPGTGNVARHNGSDNCRNVSCI